MTERKAFLAKNRFIEIIEKNAGKVEQAPIPRPVHTTAVLKVASFQPKNDIPKNKLSGDLPPTIKVPLGKLAAKFEQRKSTVAQKYKTNKDEPVKNGPTEPPASLKERPTEAIERPLVKKPPGVVKTVNESVPSSKPTALKSQKSKDEPVKNGPSEPPASFKERPAEAIDRPVVKKPVKTANEAVTSKPSLKSQSSKDEPVKNGPTEPPVSLKTEAVDRPVAKKPVNETVPSKRAALKSQNSKDEPVKKGPSDSPVPLKEIPSEALDRPLVKKSVKTVTEIETSTSKPAVLKSQNSKDEPAISPIERYTAKLGAKEPLKDRQPSGVKSAANLKRVSDRFAAEPEIKKRNKVEQVSRTVTLRAHTVNASVQKVLPQVSMNAACLSAIEPKLPIRKQSKIEPSPVPSDISVAKADRSVVMNGASESPAKPEPKNKTKKVKEEPVPKSKAEIVQNGIAEPPPVKPEPRKVKKKKVKKLRTPPVDASTTDTEVVQNGPKVSKPKPKKKSKETSTKRASLAESQVAVLESEMPSEMEKIVTRLVFRVANDKTLPDAASKALAIREEMERKYGRHWICLFGSRGGGWSASASHMTNHRIEIAVGPDAVLIFKAAQDTPCWKCGSLKCNGDCKLTQVDVRSDLPYNQQNEAKKLALDKVKTVTEASEMSKALKQSFDHKYGRYWQCIVRSGNLNHSGASLSNQHDCFAEMALGKLNICIFKASQDRKPCWKCKDINCSGQNCKLKLSIAAECSFSAHRRAEAEKMVLQITKKEPSALAIVRAVRKGFDEQFGGYWQVIVCTEDDDNYSFALTTKQNCYINFIVSNVRITAFKAEPDKVCWKCEALLCNGTSCQLKIGVCRCNLSDRFLDELKRFILNKLVAEIDALDVCDLIKEHMDTTLGQFWHCFIASGRVNEDHSYAVTSCQHLLMRIGNVTLLMFKAEKNKVEGAETPLNDIKTTGTGCIQAKEMLRPVPVRFGAKKY